MCDSQGWKSNGNKDKLIKRITKKEKARMRGRSGLEMLIESRVGEVTDKSGPAAMIRSFYSKHYGALDKFDRLWYEIKFYSKARYWRSCFCWGLLHAAVVNARSAWCAYHQTRVTTIEFIQGLVDEFSRK